MLSKRKPLLAIYLLLITPFLAAARLIHRVNSSNSDSLTVHSNPRKPENLGEGLLDGPEDILYDKESGVVYTGCRDGWIKRVKIADSAADTVIEKWVNTGGRPLGLSWLIGTKDLIVADADKGLTKIEENGNMTVLTTEANGVKFKLTDGVEVGYDDKIYFTDASSKYGIQGFMFDILEGQPNGRLLSYDLRTSRTELLASQLYFPNGLALSPYLDFAVFCETPKKRCRKYNIKGPRKGKVDNFVKLPGTPDNVHFVDGNFWIAAATLPEYVEKTEEVQKKRGWVYVVNLDGKILKAYEDKSLKFASCGLKIGDYIYSGSIMNDNIVRLPV